MKTILHKAGERGKANFGWLDSKHSFSFGNFNDPQKVHFGALRVLNDDIITGGSGFGKHPHDNMEIVSIPLYGSLEHEDSTGSKAVINENDVQIMSAGSGIQHAEKNHSATEQSNFLQIWVIPKKRNITPRHAQKTFAVSDRVNKIQTVVAPDNEEAVWINQDAWFSLTKLEKGKEITYEIKKPGNGVYAFVLEGKANLADHLLLKRDALGIWDTSQVTIKAEEDTEVLLIDVPMNLN